MSLITRVLDAAYCSTTHHKLALDALDHLRAARGPSWRNFLLTHHRVYLEGAMDPDRTFKDFSHHVLHVREDYWGGAREAVRHWYGATVRALWRKEWSLAAYNAGVLGHYVTDPLMPFHTGQTKESADIHHAVEWSIRHSYDELRALAKSRTGYPHLEAGTHPGWLDELVTAGAEISNGYYEALIGHFNFARSIKDPRAGLDQEGREMVSQLLGFATVTLARILDRAFVEAGVAPPQTHPSLEGCFALLDVPIAWVSRNLSDARERGLLEAQYREWVATGRVERTLTPNVRQVRGELAKVRAQAAQAAPPPPVAQVKEVPVSAPLQLTDAVERAPSIGPKTAECLNACGVWTVGDLMQIQPDDLARRLGGNRSLESNRSSAGMVVDWQDQARLMLEIPALEATQAAILTSAGYRTVSALASARPEELLEDIIGFLRGPHGRRSLRGEALPTLRDATTLIAWAEAASGAGPRPCKDPGKVVLPS